ncbi:major facilitator superfamily domain-containing protein [Gloeopeniophorella convolvens]|nr:major facilitator superfamily domain-containing protein [Gloeopeniophorella convolvens]
MASAIAAQVSLRDVYSPAFEAVDETKVETSTSYELNVLSSGTTERSGYVDEGNATVVWMAEASTTRAPDVQEAATSGSVELHDTVSADRIPAVLRTLRHRRLANIHFSALCWTLFMIGWNDGTTGPLLPALQQHYGIGFDVLSAIFLLNTAVGKSTQSSPPTTLTRKFPKGFIIGAVSNVYLTDRWGFGKTMVLASTCHMIAYSLQAPAGPYWMELIGYGICGFAMALEHAGANSFVGSMQADTASYLGILHGSYGVGALSSPIVMTHFIRQGRWSFQFLTSLGISTVNTVILIAVFRFRTAGEILAEAGQEPMEADNRLENKIRKIAGLNIVRLMALWALLYVGVEVMLGGWMVSFIISERHGGPNAGYITSGFFGVGRVLLLGPNRKIGGHRAMFVYAVVCIVLLATVWALPSLVENAIAVCLIGVLMGPMFPILVNYATSVLPRRLLAGGVGLIAAVGQTGSAAVPFITGLLASRFGISSMPPMVVAIMGGMTVVWAFIPPAHRRID